MQGRTHLTYTSPPPEPTLVAMNKYFPDIGRIEYRPVAGPEDTLVFRHYNASEMVHGRTMEEWMKFSVCYFNTFR